MVVVSSMVSRVPCESMLKGLWLVIALRASDARMLNGRAMLRSDQFTNPKEVIQKRTTEIAKISALFSPAVEASLRMNP
jgi:hypothetical protein